MAQNPSSDRGTNNVHENDSNNYSRSQTDNNSHAINQTVFSIATPAITTILPIAESISDTSFMLHHSNSSYSSDITLEQTYSTRLTDSKSIHNNDRETFTRSENELGKNNVLDLMQQNTKAPPKETTETAPTSEQMDTVKQVSFPHDEQGVKLSKKRSRIMKKSTKLDAKSKLEKSRQSARECRARKKLRYQYLEDLVCNREKAVIKLREELTMFCELSKQIGDGNITEANRRLLTDQTKENTCNESTSLT